LSGTGKLESQQFEGVLQEQLAPTLKDVRDCKLTVLKMVLDQVRTASMSQARDPNSLYQYGEIVGEVQGAIVQQANGTIQFAMITCNSL
jgi:hypothetical protein